MRTHESDKVLTNHKFNNELMPIIINNIYFMDITYLEWGNTLYRVKYKNDHWLKKKIKIRGSNHNKICACMTYYKVIKILTINFSISITLILQFSH